MTKKKIPLGHIGGAFLVAFAALLGAGGAVRADDASAPGLLGDWNGERTRLQEDGLSFKLGFTVEGAYNPVGGDRHTFDQAGQLSLGTTADLDKLFGISNARLQVTITKREGGNLNEKAGIPALQQVQEIYGRGNIWRLSEFSYDQTYFDDTLDLKLGRVNPGDDFAVFACDFQNLTFCGAQPGNIAGSYWMNSPVSQWGTRLKVNIAKQFYVEGGAYQVSPRNTETGFALGPHGGTGALLPAEIGWVPEENLPGVYKFGGWYSTADEDDLFFDVNRQPQVITGMPPLERDGSFGGYFNARQQVTGDANDPDKRGLTLFLNAVVADHNTVQTDRQFAVGASYAGPFAARPKDALGLAFGITHVSGRVADGQEVQNASGLTPVPVQKSEYASELDYRIQATNWLAVDPNLQYIHEPGGTDDNHDALVLGMRLAVTL
ncbi:MAG: carbohydrate porin [Parvibaculum sp.]|uniref:carbohydrate porin n=1 Tax=Parvibaculum sp. TaxID=2024848 RepID=UPI0025F95286|nr:carbohydrate porin [Parvibaculum sp.]MCE9650508.1 carbohydrate porin [Parvibaculum sp.]